jgi:hypothetical protein
VPAFLKMLALALRLHTYVPGLGWDEALDHAAAATSAATPRVQPELLLAIAFVESRFDPTATSRVEGGKRKTGHYPSTAPPVDLAPRASLYCGPLQTFAASWGECIGLRRLPTAYAAGVAELEQWLRDKRVRGDVVLALAGHGCGNFGVTTGRCNAYPARVLGMRRLFAVPEARAVATQARAAPRS